MTPRRYRKVLWGLIAVLLLLWGLGLYTGWGGNLIHVLLVLVLIALRDATAPAKGVGGVEGPLGKPLEPPR